jgi:hypothetical protein
MVPYRREMFQVAEAVLFVLDGEVFDILTFVFDQLHSKCRVSGFNVCVDSVVESLNNVAREVFFK